MKKCFGFLMMVFVILFSGCGNNNRSQNVDTEATEKNSIAPKATSISVATATPIPTPTAVLVYSTNWVDTTYWETYEEEEITPEPTPEIQEEPDWTNMREALKIHEGIPSDYYRGRGEYAVKYLNNNSEVKISINLHYRTFSRCENDDWEEYNIDTMYLPFEYELIFPIAPDANLGLEGFSIVLDKTTQEVVCVQYSEEIGRRTKIPAEIATNLDAFRRNDINAAFRPYLIDDLDGISFEIKLIEDNVEKLSCSSKIFSNIPKLYKDETFDIQTFDSENEEFGDIFLRKDGSMFTIVDTNVANWVRSDRWYVDGTDTFIQYQCIPYLYEEINVEKTDFNWEDLSNFTISGRWCEFSYVDCIARIDETHELLLTFDGQPWLMGFDSLLEKGYASEYIQSLDDNSEGYLAYLKSEGIGANPEGYSVPNFDKAVKILKKILKTPTN